MRTLACLVLLGLALPARAAEGDVDLERLATDVSKAVADADYAALAAACEQAPELRRLFDAEQLDPLVRALADGAGQRDLSIAILSVKTLGELRCSGSSRYLTRLLTPARELTLDAQKLHVAAIEAAGQILDPDCAPRLEKLVTHDNTVIAVAACAALGRYSELEPKPRMVIIKHLVTTLGRLEKRRPRTAVDRAHHAEVLEALAGALRELTDQKQLTTATEFRTWLRHGTDGTNAG